MKARNWKKFLASGLFAAAIIFCLMHSGPAVMPPGDELAAVPPGDELTDSEIRVVLLAPAAADLFERLGAGAGVVGVTNSVEGFPAALRVGTHLHPGLEKVAALRPGLIVAPAGFSPNLAARLGADLFVYDPKSLDEIISSLRRLAAALGREEQGRALADELQAVLNGLEPPEHRPTVLYETRSNPLAVAGNGSVIKDLLERAGMRYAYPKSGGVLSAEYLLARQPEFYIYQQGPMNKNPLPPAARPGWGGFAACAWKVNEFDFARPNTRLFETVRQLNAIITTENACAHGQSFYR